MVSNRADIVLEPVGDDDGTIDPQESALQKRFHLADLIEQESFRDVMTAFADLYRIGVKVFDVAGNKLVDIRVGNTQFCGYLWENGGSRQACTKLVTSLKNDGFELVDGTETARVVDCFSGLRYVVLPLHYEGYLIGRRIFGPYTPQALDEASPQVYHS